jgi:hypothetical protein
MAPILVIWTCALLDINKKGKGRFSERIRMSVCISGHICLLTICRLNCSPFVPSPSNHAHETPMSGKS